MRLAAGDLDELGRALRASGLPGEIGAEAVVYQLEDETGPLGWAALECSGEAALLRSVLVVNDRRGRGVGTDLIERMIGAAGAEGASSLWLLTETAAPFFARLGFVHADREMAPEPILATAEFSRLCPASAECMTMAIHGER